MIEAAGWSVGCSGWACTGHEVLLRSKGGDPRDPTQMLAIGSTCHQWIHGHVTASKAAGLLVHPYPSHDAHDRARAAVSRIVGGGE